MHVPPYLWDDAISEGAFAGYQAMKRWRTGAGTAPETWVILKMRYVIRDLLRKELEHTPAPIEWAENFQAVDGVGVDAWHDVCVALEQLEQHKAYALVSTAWGELNATVSHALKVNGVQLKSLRLQAQQELLAIIR